MSKIKYKKLKKGGSLFRGAEFGAFQHPLATNQAKQWDRDNFIAKNKLNL